MFQKAGFDVFQVINRFAEWAFVALFIWKGLFRIFNPFRNLFYTFLTSLLAKRQFTDGSRSCRTVPTTFQANVCKGSVRHQTHVLRHPTFFFSSLFSAITVDFPRSCFENRDNQLSRTWPWKWNCWRITHRVFPYLGYSSSNQTSPRMTDSNGWE